VYDLLVRRGRRLRPTPSIVEQHLDGRAIDDIEADDVAPAVAAYLKCRGVEYKYIFKGLAKPSREGLLTVRFASEFC
jgi:hypothetical protein